VNGCHRALLAIVLTAWVLPAQAAVIDLFERAFKVDNVFTAPTDPLPSGISSAGFDFGTGLGTFRVSVAGSGAHYVAGFFDLEIVEINNSFFNESGAANGTPAAGQTWEIDEPGFGIPDGAGGVQYTGDIFGNVQAGALDNRVFFDAINNQSFSDPDDVAMALAYAFTLAAGEQALIDFIISDMLPVAVPDFYLSQTDSDSDVTAYLYSTLTISAIPTPEPGTLLLISLALVGVGCARRRAA